MQVGKYRPLKISPPDPPLNLRGGNINFFELAVDEEGVDETDQAERPGDDREKQFEN